MFYRQLKPLYLKRYKRSVVSIEQQINQSDLVQKDTSVPHLFFLHNLIYIEVLLYTNFSIQVSPQFWTLSRFLHIG